MTDSQTALILGLHPGPDRDYLLSLFPEEEMVSLASMLGNGMDERVSSFLVRRFAEAVVEDERMEKASYAAQYLDSFIS